MLFEFYRYSAQIASTFVPLKASRVILPIDMNAFKRAQVATAMTSVAIHDSKPTRHREFCELSAVKVVTFALQFGSKNPYSYRYLRKK